MNEAGGNAIDHENHLRNLREVLLHLMPLSEQEKSAGELKCAKRKQI